MGMQARAEVHFIIDQAIANMRQLETQAQQTGQTVGGAFNASSAEANSFMLNMAGVGLGLTAASRPINSFFKSAVTSAMDFEQQISAVGAVSDATAEELDMLRERALQVGADTSFTAVEVAAAMEVMAKAGIPLVDLYNGVAEAAVRLSEATGVDVVLASETAAAAMTVFGHSAEEADDVMNVIAQSANASMLEVEDWTSALMYAGPIVATLGYDIEDLAHMMVILGDAGMRGSVASTSIRNILMQISDSSSKATEGIQGYGIALTDAEGNSRSLMDIMTDLVPHWNELNDAARVDLANQWFGARGGPAFLNMMNAHTEAVNRGGNAFEEAGEKMELTGDIYSMSEKRMDNLAGAVERLSGSFDTFMILIGNALTPGLRFLAEALDVIVDAMADIPRPIMVVLAHLGALTGVVMAVAGAIMLAIPGIVAFQGALAKIGGMSTVFNILRAAMFGAFSAALPVMLAVGVAIAAILAYQNNFLGFADGINAIAKAFWNLEVVKQVRAWIEGVIAAFENFFYAFRRSGSNTQEIQQRVNIEVTGDDKVLERIANPDAADGFDYYVRIKNPDGSLKEFGQIMESHTDPENPNIANIKVKTEDGEYWTTIDTLTGEIGTGTIEVNDNGTIERANSGIKRLQMGLAAAEGALRRRNMPFLANIVKGISEALTGVERFQRVWKSVFDARRQSGVNVFVAALEATARGLINAAAFMGPFEGHIRSIGEWLQKAADIAQEATNRFTAFREEGLSPLRAVGETIVSFFGDLRDVMDHVYNVADKLLETWGHLGDALSSLFEGDWSGMFSSLGEAFVSAFEGMTEFVLGIGALFATIWDVVAPHIANFGSRLWSWFQEQMSGIPWSDIFNGAISILASAGSWIYDKIVEGVNLILSLGVWFYEQVTQINWSGLFKVAIAGLSEAGQWIVDTFTSAKEKIEAWFIEQFGEVNWVEVATGAADKLAAAIGDAVSAMVSIRTKLINWLTEQINSVSWSKVGEEFGRLLGIALKAAIGLIALAGKFLLQLMIELGKVDWPTLAAAMWGLFVAALTASWDFMTGLVNGFFEEFSTAWGDLSWSDLWDVVAAGLEGTLDPVFTWIEGKINWMIDQLNRLPMVDIDKIGEEGESEVEFEGGGGSGGGGGGSRSTFDFGRMGPSGAMPSISPGVSAALREAAIAAGVFNKSLTILNPTLEHSREGIDRTTQSLPLLTSATNEANVATGAMGGTVASAFGTIAAAAASQTQAAAANAISNFTNMRSQSNSQMNTMQGYITGRLAATSAAVALQSVSARNSAVNQFSDMNSTVSLRMAAMALNSALQFRSVASTADEQGKATSTKFTGALAGAVTRTTVVLAGIPGIVTNMGNTAAGNAYSAGANISRSFADGMSAYLWAIRASAAAMVAAADAAVQARARIASPSKMAIWWADMIAGAFVDQIEGYQSPAADAMQGLISEPSINPNMFDNFARAAEGFTNFNNRQEQADMLANMMDRITGNRFGGVTPSINVNIITLPHEEWVRFNEAQVRNSTFVRSWQEPESIAQYLGDY